MRYSALERRSRQAEHHCVTLMAQVRCHWAWVTAAAVEQAEACCVSTGNAGRREQTLARPFARADCQLGSTQALQQENTSCPGLLTMRMPGTSPHRPWLFIRYVKDFPVSLQGHEHSFTPTSPTALRSEFPQPSARAYPRPPPLCGWNLGISRQQFRLFMGTLRPSGETDHPQRSALSVRPRRHCSSPQRSQLVGPTLETGPDCLRAACKAAASQWHIGPGHTQSRPSVQLEIGSGWAMPLSRTSGRPDWVALTTRRIKVSHLTKSVC